MKSQLLEALNTSNERNIFPRLRHLGLLENCGRCGGGGRYGPQSVEAGRCFGCNGTGLRVPRITKKLVATVREKVEAGELIPYLEKNRKIREAKAAISPLRNEIEAIFRPLWDAYEAAYRAVYRKPRTMEEIPADLLSFQTESNMLFWGHDKPTDNTSVCGIERLAKKGQIPAPEAVELLKGIREKAQELMKRAGF